MFDYQGRSYLHIPQDVGVSLRSSDAPDKCYLPKKQLHVWSGHTKVSGAWQRLFFCIVLIDKVQRCNFWIVKFFSQNNVEPFQAEEVSENNFELQNGNTIFVVSFVEFIVHSFGRVSEKPYQSALKYKDTHWVMNNYLIQSLDMPGEKSLDLFCARKYG